MNGNLTPAGQYQYATSPARRAEFFALLANIGAFYETHPRAPLPDHIVFNIDNHGDDPADREHDVKMTAIELGVPAVWQDGLLCAARRFGPATLEKHTTPARKAAA
jgi:hypothetical protein